ncbi:unnamed protein product [Cylicocyclus nassatus]|uniref:Uncharacterized protein n=1 Tax=Cylicocyclus nassatus TaxID=53992 RepID=A0AA36H1U2_CYLNA|nr:unnamed protein product [Cylicocyclus nassatus]
MDTCLFEGVFTQSQQNSCKMSSFCFIHQTFSPSSSTTFLNLYIYVKYDKLSSRPHISISSS